MFGTIGKILQWIGKHFWGLLFVLIVLLVLMPEAAPTHSANLQEIKLTGPIISGDTVVKEIEKAAKDTKIKGVLFSVDSPGGAIAPSIEIAYAIKALREKKPVVAYAGSTMASGGYYASIYADTIIANPGAIVGSIGVILESANVKQLMDKIGIEPQTVKEGVYKEAGTMLRRWTPREREELERLVSDNYALFVKDVATARKLDLNDSQRYADAHIFSAKRALEAGLIDRIGVKQEAREEVKKRAKVREAHWKEKDKLHSLLEKLSQNALLQIQSYFYGLKAIL
jgi:protease-4